MKKSEFLGIRIGKELQLHLNELIDENEDFRNMTDLATRALTEFVEKQVEIKNQNAMTNIDYPELIKEINQCKKLDREVLLGIIPDLKYDEVNAVYSMMRRHNMRKGGTSSKNGS